MRLRDKTAIVTGATSGIGRAIALLFAKEGAFVIGVGTRQAKADEILKLAQEEGLNNLEFFIGDISIREEVEKLFDTVLNKFGKIDCLVNNAGINRDGLLMKMSDEDWNRVLDVNLTAAFYTCRQALRPMMRAKSGSIVNVTSVVGLIGNPGQCNYAASKAGMVGFTKSLAKEIASRGIRANCIAPGYIDTDMTVALGEEKCQKINESIPMKRMGHADEIAQAALYLCTDATYMTGQTLVLDGGLT